MKWDKALTYLIIMFLTLNIGLAIGNYNKNVKAYRMSDKRWESIVSVLRENDIIVKSKVPNRFRPIAPIGVLPVEITPSMREEIVKKFLGPSEELKITKEIGDNPYEQAVRVYIKGEKELRIGTNYVHYTDKSIQEEIQFVGENQAIQMAEQFLKQVKMEQYAKKLKIEYEPESYGASVTYYEVYDSFPIFGSYMHMKINEKGVFETILHKNTVEDKIGSKKPIQPIDTVLFGLIDELSAEKTVIIEAITLGYAVPNVVEMHVLREEAIPMYKISIQGLDEPIFVNAYTNTVEELPTGTFYK